MVRNLSENEILLQEFKRRLRTLRPSRKIAEINENLAKREPLQGERLKSGGLSEGQSSKAFEIEKYDEKKI